MTHVLVILFVFVVVFTYAPIIAMAVLSFNTGSGLTFPILGLGTSWYSLVIQDTVAIRALFQGVKLSLVVMAVTTVLGVLTGLAFRRKIPGRNFVFYLILLGIIVPGEIYGLGSGLLFSTADIRYSIWTAVPVEVVYTLPFGLILILARFDPDLASYENVARSLGATEWVVMRQVTFPLISREVIATALFSFTLSFGELLRSLFVVGSDATLPVFVYSTVSNSPMTPEFFALATITIGISFLLLASAALVLFLGQTRKLRLQAGI
jgi:putative spermidine/putrescine transport system permease protein